MKRTWEQSLFIAVFLTPAFLLFTVFVAVPGARALLYSLQKWDGLSKPEWVGLSNFAALFRDDLFRIALGHNVFLTVTAGSATILLALFFAAVLHRRVRGSAIFRVAFFFPNVIASVAVALLWLLLYSTTDFGVLNGFLAWMKETVDWPAVSLPIPFTGKPYLVYSVVPMLVWTATGFYMVLFLAAMEGIPESFYEVAELEGVSPFGQFWHITLPLIREVVVVGVVFLVIGSLKLFEAIWIMDNEWPSKETHVMATLLYQKVFSEYNVGYGSAVAVLMFVLVFVATLATLRFSRREALEY
ncbi:MAG: sugar ABC transporter permease [Candidatus Hydrogenedentes bacterium]|nr:sugar ABC transporter permease [Candidatus Hydrogenedentota bacterium]